MKDEKSRALEASRYLWDGLKYMSLKNTISLRKDYSQNQNKMIDDLVIYHLSLSS